MINLSHPSIHRAQQMANRRARTMILYPNIIGGIDIVDAQRLSVDQQGETRRPIAIVHPQPMESPRCAI